ncbi:MAG: carboxy-S-adenosyl-L-methionine synthase CmoA [Kangiellaceae bacterium]
MKFNNDNIYKTNRKNSPFRFNEQVASVFPDMIGRSVPGYFEVIKMIEELATRFVTNNSHCYDLGCSLGESTLAIDRGIRTEKINIFAIDNSKAMLERCQLYLSNYKHHASIELRCEDICKTLIENASMVVLNYTLQFLPLEARDSLLKSIFDGMNSGGILLISEKINMADPTMNQLLIDLHHQFKKNNGYSDLEISQKRNALENILITESLNKHLDRLEKAGFQHVSVWQQQLNFASLIAIK